MNNDRLNKKIKYLLKRDVDTNGLNNCEINRLYKKTRKHYQDIGQKNRVKKLIDSGAYTFDENVGKTFKCLMCGKKYKYKKSVSNKEGYCGISCYKKTGDVLYKLKKTYIINKGVDIIDMEKCEINEIYSKFKVDEINISQKKRVKTINDKGENEWSRMTTLGNERRKINFLINNDIINESDNFSKERINYLFLKNFNEITKHGEKIKKSCIKKHDGYENYKKELFSRFVNFGMNKLKESGFDLELLSPKELEQEVFKYYKKTKKKTNIIEWKKRCLDYDFPDKISDKEVELLYSEYISKRMNLVDNIRNGYRKTKKGYYQFKNIDRKMFFRSSWEESIFEILDEMIFEEKIIDVGAPERIEYFYKFNRHYYPDVYYIKKCGEKIVCEIKPKSKISEEMNLKKIKKAKEIFGDNFIVLTEYEVFSDKIKSILLK